MSNQSIDTNGLVTIRYVLASLKSALAIDDREDERLIQFIVDGISEINMFYVDISGTKKGLFPISSINTVDLPSDFIDYVMIGRVVNGRVVSLSKNKNLAIPVSEECSLSTNPYSGAITEYPKYHHFGLGGGYNIAEYEIDKRDRRILISGNVPNSEIYMEYISTGVSVNEETSIPRQAVPAIKAYVIWQMTENDDKKPLYDKQRKARIWTQKLEELANSVNAMTIDEILDEIYKGYRQTPKR